METSFLSYNNFGSWNHCHHREIRVTLCRNHSHLSSSQSLPMSISYLSSTPFGISASRGVTCTPDIRIRARAICYELRLDKKMHPASIKVLRYGTSLPIPSSKLVYMLVPIPSLSFSMLNVLSRGRPPHQSAACASSDCLSEKGTQSGTLPLCRW